MCGIPAIFEAAVTGEVAGAVFLVHGIFSRTTYAVYNRMLTLLTVNHCLKYANACFSVGYIYLSACCTFLNSVVVLKTIVKQFNNTFERAQPEGFSFRTRTGFNIFFRRCRVHTPGPEDGSSSGGHTEKRLTRRSVLVSRVCQYFWTRAQVLQRLPGLWQRSALFVALL